MIVEARKANAISEYTMNARTDVMEDKLSANAT